MKRILVVDPYARKRRYLAWIFRRHAGDHVSLLEGMKPQLPDVAGFDLVYVWNGQHDKQREAVEAANAAGTPLRVLELGFFPQEDHCFCDPLGVGPNSSVYRDPDALEPDCHALDDARDWFLGHDRWVGGGGFTLVPLQLEGDTNVVLHSDFISMRQFAEHCRESIDGPIVFKHHPKARRVDVPELEDCRYVFGGASTAWIRRADMVYGINSTVLLEAELMGAPMNAIGRGHAERCNEDPEYLARLVTCQVRLG